MYNQDQYQNNYNQNNHVLMDHDDNFNGFSSKAVRLGFVRKTIGIFTMQIIITFSGCLYVSLSPESKLAKIIENNLALFIIACVLNLVILICINCTSLG